MQINFPPGRFFRWYIFEDGETYFHKNGNPFHNLTTDPCDARGKGMALIFQSNSIIHIKTMLCQIQIRVDPTKTIPPANNQAMNNAPQIPIKEKQDKPARELRDRREKRIWGKGK
jgi:hypothetical protein